MIELDVEGGSGASFLESHDGFKENSGTTFRFPPIAPDTGLWECDENGCVDTAAFGHPPGNHATGVAGVIFGDLMDSQIGSITGADRERGSGYAPEARAHLYLIDDAGSDDSPIAAYDHIENLAAGEWPPEVVNNSYQFGTSPHCAGTSTLAREANELFLNGFAVISGAGNTGGSSTDCEVRAPGDAIGSFTVGAHLANVDLSTDALDVRTGPIYDSGVEFSAWGGNSMEGQNRSIISITAPGRRRGRFDDDGTVTFSSSSGVPAATSLATATVSGAALSIMSYHMSGGSGWIGNPGALYAALLVMGDRQKTSAGKAFARVDHRWGVGRLRARLLGATGLDEPFRWFHGSTCIAHNEAWDFYLEETALPDDINAVKAAAYWFDHRHENSGDVANVDIGLFRDGLVFPLAADTDADDNKAFVFLEDAPNNNPLKLRLSGINVQGHDDPLCGQDAIRVYYAIFAEDSDRNSPTYDATTGIGVAPEDI